jgi:nucleoside-diphosphate-sugar epimerase
VKALHRRDISADKIRTLAATGAEPVAVDHGDVAALRDVMTGAVCLVSALSGLEETIVDTQSRLLDAAVAAGVPRFIPSDFSLDFTTLPEGSNRNFDLRRQFRRRLDAAPIRATSIFNGGFADMLVGEMPLVVKPLRRILYWQDADVKFALTTKDDTAEFTAAAALDPQAPRDLHIAGSSVSSRDLAAIMSEVSGEPYGLFYAGSLKLLGRLIALTRRLAPQPQAVFPPWQGMQYVGNMFSGLATSAPTDNDRYGLRHWTTAREVLARG